jgi:hypothetical protein
MSAINIGTLVWSGYSGLLRVGTVVSKRIAENGWAYFTIEWHDDGRYESVQNYYRSLNPNGEYGLKEYKASFVHPVTPEQLEKFASSHRDLIDQDDDLPTADHHTSSPSDDVIDFLF